MPASCRDYPTAGCSSSGILTTCWRGNSRRQRVRPIRSPTLLVWGANDGISPPELAKDFQAAIKGSRVEIIAGAGHLPGTEKPEELLKVVEAFIG